MMPVMSTETTTLRVVTETRGGKNGKRLIRSYEHSMTLAQAQIWNELCDPLTTDEALRLSMLDAALKVKHDNLERVMKALELPEESVQAVKNHMDTRRIKILTEDLNDQSR